MASLPLDLPCTELAAWIPHRSHTRSLLLDIQVFRVLMLELCKAISASKDRGAAPLAGNVRLSESAPTNVYDGYILLKIIDTLRGHLLLHLITPKDLPLLCLGHDARLPLSCSFAVRKNKENWDFRSISYGKKDYPYCSFSFAEHGRLTLLRTRYD